MSFSPQYMEMVVQQVREWMAEKGATRCPLCNQESWEFDHAGLVFLISTSGGREIGSEGQARVGSRPSAESELRRLRMQLRVVRNAANSNRLVQLTCGNCAHVLLLKANMILKEDEPLD